MALSYGSRHEIISSIKKIKKDLKKINESDISENLMTSNFPDPDLVIRTSGEKDYLIFCYGKLLILNYILQRLFGQILTSQDILMH